MKRGRWWIAAAWLVAWLGLGACRAQPPAERVDTLRRGINLTGWFRYPASRDPAALATWITDAALGDLARAGFGFVRLPVEPDMVADPAIRAVLLRAIRRIQGHGMAVVVEPHPANWRLEKSAADRAALLAFWTRLAPDLRALDPGRLFPEILNEPVFADDPAAWHRLQEQAYGIVRAILPDATAILTGHDWGSVRGLLALTPRPERNVVYSVHYYDPAEMTALASYRRGLDRAALSRLPFPWEETRCAATNTDAETAGLIRYLCAMRWDAARVRAGLALARDWGRRHGVHVVVGEFGADIAWNRPSRLAWLSAVRTAAEESGMGWALWGYDDIMGFAVRRPLPARPVLDPGVLTALGLSPAAPK